MKEKRVPVETFAFFFLSHLLLGGERDRKRMGEMRQRPAVTQNGERLLTGIERKVNDKSASWPKMDGE